MHKSKLGFKIVALNGGKSKFVIHGMKFAPERIKFLIVSLPFWVVEENDLFIFNPNVQFSKSWSFIYL